MDPEYFQKQIEMQIEAVERALDHFDSLSQAEIEMLSKGPQRGPPVLFEFCTGGGRDFHSKLPVFGRHFKICVSKIPCGIGNDKVIQTIYEILHCHFPDHVVHWRDDYMDTKYFRSAPGEEEGRADFYRKLEEQFDKFKQARTAREFRSARKTFAGIQ